MEQEKQKSNKSGIYFLALVILIVGYLFALGNRYVPINETKILVDTWTKKCYYPDGNTGELITIDK